MAYVKKIISVIIAFALIFSFSALSASAVTYSDGKFEYTVNRTTNEATVTNYLGSDTAVSVPMSFGNYLVTAIAPNALADNPNVQNIYLPTSVVSIGDSAFANDTALQNITINESAVTLGDYLFLNCTSLEYAVIHSNIDTIPEGAFYGCSQLALVYLNSTFRNVGNFAFSDCTALNYISNFDLLENIGAFAFYNSGFSTVTIPQNVTEIPQYAFANCANLGIVDIPDSVTSIDAAAFDGSESVVIHCSVGSYAHSFAAANSIPFVINSPFVVGDVNRDGYVDVTDTTLIQKYLAGMVTIDAEQIYLADFDNDGKATLVDATCLQKFLVGLLNSDE